MDADTKRLVCRMVGGLLASDEAFEDSERSFLDKLLTQFGIPEQEWDAVFPLMEAPEAELALQEMDSSVQHEIFETLLAAAGADREVAPEEEQYLVTVARAIGLNEDAVSKRLDDAGF